MRILKTAIVTAVLLASGGAPAAAQDYYAGGQLGASSGGGVLSFVGLDLVLDRGVTVSGFYGKYINNFRIEAELAYRRNDIESFLLVPVAGEMSSLALMENLLYDFGDGAGVTPYVGFGVGVANVTMDSADFLVSDSDLAIATQLMMGVAFPLSENMSLNLDMRSFAALPEFKDSGGSAFRQGDRVSSLAVGLQTSF